VNVFRRIALGLAAFLLVAGVVYGAVSQEYVGGMLFLLCAAGFAFIGLFVRHAIRESDAAAAEADAAYEEPHIGPTIWPFVLAVGGFGVVLGIALSPWIAVVGAALFVVAGVGWFRDVGRQWSHDRQH